MNNNIIYKIENMYFNYDSENTNIFNGLSMDIGKNSIIAVLGPNGSGKSTLIRLLCKILKPSKGRILLYGRDILQYTFRELSRLIAYIPQNFLINFNYSVYDIIETGRYPHMPSVFSKLQDNDCRVIENALLMWGLEGFRHRSILELSGGERQLTIIASAIAQSSRILLFDEPTSNLDLMHIKLFIRNLKKLKNDHDLIIIVTHDINLASILADNILYIKDAGYYIQDKKDQILNRTYLERVFDTGIREEKGLFYIDG